MKLTLNAKLLRAILFTIVLVNIFGGAAGFIIAKNTLQEFATSINQIEADAAAGDGNIAALQQLQGTLKTTGDIKTKVDSIAVPAIDYPVVVIQNITDIANKAGLKLTSVSYGDSNSTSTSGGGQQTAPSTTAPTPGSGGAGAATTSPAATTPTVSGVTKKTINVTTESPVNYNALMSFLQGIESDDMYMNITKVSMTKSTGNTVTTQPFTIEVYVR